jgi:hypothetical protein
MSIVLSLSYVGRVLFPVKCQLAARTAEEPGQHGEKQPSSLPRIRKSSEIAGRSFAREAAYFTLIPIYSNILSDPATFNFA